MITVVLFLVAIVGQVIGASLLPATRGFTAIGPTAACLGTFTLAFFAMSRLIQSGVNLSLVVPIMAAAVPLVVIAISVLVYGESASPAKIALLVGATIAIGLAGKFG